MAVVLTSRYEATYSQQYASMRISNLYSLLSGGKWLRRWRRASCNRKVAGLVLSSPKPSVEVSLSKTPNPDDGCEAIVVKSYEWPQVTKALFKCSLFTMYDVAKIVNSLLKLNSRIAIINDQYIFNTIHILL